MSRSALHIGAVVMLAAGFLMCATDLSWASENRAFRLGYLDHPGSILCRVAADKGHFRKEGLKVELVRFADVRQGLAALAAGAVDAGVFPAGETLSSIASGTGIRIIAGGGTVVAGNPEAELAETGRADTHSQGIVVSIPRKAPPKAAITQLTAGLIRAYRTVRQHPETVSRYAGRLDDLVVFDPNPDYWRLERTWRSLGLQNAAMKHDFLADHVYEEIYCDALDRLLDSSGDDQVFKELSSKAVCTPDCCPKSAWGK
ncbi:MAG TPA: ABC transporter substrate-binding protein [Geobacteraceae bacterium]